VNGSRQDARGVAAPLGLLLLFVLVIRALPAVSRPPSPSDDCDRVSVSDVSAMERCLAIRTDDVELMLDLGEAYERSGQRDRADAIYARALAVDPRDADVRARREALRARPESAPDAR
jgi:hypothetical protein